MKEQLIELLKEVEIDCCHTDCFSCRYDHEELSCKALWFIDKLLKSYNITPKQSTITLPDPQIIEPHPHQADFVYIKPDNEAPKFFNIKQITTIAKVNNYCWAVRFSDCSVIEITPDLARSLFEILGIEEK